jgi:hypothetical protein
MLRSKSKHRSAPWAVQRVRGLGYQEDMGDDSVEPKQRSEPWSVRTTKDSASVEGSCWNNPHPNTEQADAPLLARGKDRQGVASICEESRRDTVEHCPALETTHSLSWH